MRGDLAGRWGSRQVVMAYEPGYTCATLGISKSCKQKMSKS